MKAFAMVLLAASLCGCTITPGEVRARSPIYETRIAAAPDVAAACLTQILDEVRAPTSHRVVVHRDRGMAEVIGSSSMATFLVITLQDAGNGTTVASVRRPPIVIQTQDDEDYARAIAACGKAA